MNLRSPSNSFSKALFWAKPGHGNISLAVAVDGGAMSNASLSANLSDEELNKADLLTDPIESRHFVFRRCFQRVFLQALLDFAGHPKQIAVAHQQDHRPVCLNAPHYQLSFSSSAGATLVAASSECDVGVDIERIRPIENAAALARRFFTNQEAEIISDLPLPQQSLAFLKSWTAKEAGLKAIGKGIVFGLNTFVRTADDRIYAVVPERQSDIPTPWALEYIDILPDHMVAVVHRPRKKT